MQCLRPSDHDFVMLAQDPLPALIEVGLQVLVVFPPMSVDEGLDFRICLPLMAVDLISPNMKIVVGEELGHLINKLVDEPVGFLPRWIHDCISAAGLDRIRSRPARQLRISREQWAAVYQHLELAKYVDTTIIDVFH